MAEHIFERLAHERGITVEEMRAIWSCQDLFSPRVQGFQILGDLSLLGHHIARWRRQVKGGDSRGEANPLDVAPTVCYPLPQAACVLACSR